MRFIVIFIILALAAGAAYITYQMTAKEGEVQVKEVVKTEVIKEEVQKSKILTAAKDIPVGAVITKEYIEVKEWPTTLLLPEFITTGSSDELAIDNMIARAQFRKGEPMIKSKLANPGDPSFLAGTLDYGNRAITIALDETSGVAGFVFPGDRVDVLITHSVDFGSRGSGAEGTSRQPVLEPMSEVLLSNIRVLALDQRYASEEGEKPLIPRSVTLEVTPIQAQKIRLAENTSAKLSLVLRGLKDQNADGEEVAESLPRPIGKRDLSRVTPPSYFPVLFNSDESYQPRLVDPFPKLVDAGGDDGEPTADLSDDPFDMEEIAGQGMGAKSMYQITVIRGTDSEIVKVEE
jgi:pilus assembly protein CpaB